MIKITHYEVYTDNGSGWQLEDRFAAEQRHDAFNLAKEREIDKLKVKIIKEIFDVKDNSYQESVEYVNTSGGKTVTIPVGKNIVYPDLSADNSERSQSEVPHVHSTVPKAILKLLMLIVLCLIFANLLVSLLYPILEQFVPEENSKPVMFGIFFVLFLGITIPLVLKQVPWHVFVFKKSEKAPIVIKERRFYDKAEELIRIYKLNDDIDPVVTPVYPEAPLEYKRYIISFLSEIISNINSQTSLQSNFSKLGVRLIIYGGCLELARYSGLSISQANSLLHESFSILDGENADLADFYEAKRAYRDNKVAIFLTGVGAYLMANVMQGNPMPTDILGITFAKWENLCNEEFEVKNKENIQPIREESEIFSADDIMQYNLVSIKDDLKFLDNSIPNQEDVSRQTTVEVQNIIHALISKYKGDLIGEDNGITSVQFKKLNNGMKFATECLKDISVYQEKLNNDNLILRNCCIIIEQNPLDNPKLNDYLEDMFEHVYNNEIVLTQVIRDALEGEKYSFDFLGEKKLAQSQQDIALYKLEN